IALLPFFCELSGFLACLGRKGRVFSDLSFFGPPVHGIGGECNLFCFSLFPKRQAGTGTSERNPAEFADKYDRGIGT
ncbi:MAG: hypothetical protein ACI4I8_06710, partial [Oscillospiraceae bacterium]